MRKPREAFFTLAARAHTCRNSVGAVKDSSDNFVFSAGQVDWASKQTADAADMANLILVWWRKRIGLSGYNYYNYGKLFVRFSDTVFSVLMLPLPAVKCLGSWIAPGKEAAAETHATRCAQCCYMLLHVSNQQTNQGTPLSKSQQANIHTRRVPPGSDQPLRPLPSTRAWNGLVGHAHVFPSVLLFCAWLLRVLPRTACAIFILFGWCNPRSDMERFGESGGRVLSDWNVGEWLGSWAPRSGSSPDCDPGEEVFHVPSYAGFFCDNLMCAWFEEMSNLCFFVHEHHVKIC